MVLIIPYLTNLLQYQTNEGDPMAICYGLYEFIVIGKRFEKWIGNDLF